MAGPRSSFDGVSRGGVVVTVALALVLTILLPATPAEGHEFPLAGDYVGDMPYPPGAAAAAGALRLPQAGNFGGQNYDCRRFVDSWGVLGPQMRGVVIASNPATGQVHGFFARSGAWVGNAANPIPPPVLAGHPNQGPVHVWTQAQTAPAEVTALSLRVNNLFNAARKCFGVPTTTGTCRAIPGGGGLVRIQRVFAAGGGPENGVDVGACALAKIIMHMTTRGYAVAPVNPAGLARNYAGIANQPVAQANIICAAEKTGGGWALGYNVAPGAAAVAVPYGALEMVHSCASCQQQVPMLFGAECNVAAPANGALGGCPAQLVHGDTCIVACNHGAPIGPPTRCNNGAAVVQACPPPPPPPPPPPAPAAVAAPAGMIRRCLNNVCSWVRANPGKALVIGAAVVGAAALGAKKKLRRSMPQDQLAADAELGDLSSEQDSKADSELFRQKLKRASAQRLGALLP